MSNATCNMNGIQIYHANLALNYVDATWHISGGVPLNFIKVAVKISWLRCSVSHPR